MRVCAEPGCPKLVTAGRCAECMRERERARPSKQQRGYDAEYQRQRAADLRALNAGTILNCWRCGRVVWPHDYSLGHCDDDRRIIHGPEHLRACNLANTRGNCPHPSHIPPAA